MPVAVVSDIHSNLHALEAVLEALDADAPDELWCLGDVVGYGPRPNECCAIVEQRADVCLAGNHDLGVLGTVDLSDFSPDAANAAYWTRDALAAGLFFGIVRAMANTLETRSGYAEGTLQLLKMLPYVVSLLALAGVAGRSGAPAALGRPYVRE